MCGYSGGYSVFMYVQWNLSNLDTLGSEESVLISVVVTYTNMAAKYVLFIKACIHFKVS